MADTKKKNRLKSDVISFRLTEAQHRLLTTIHKNDAVTYVRSPNGLARKIVCDFIAGRLAYTNTAHRYVDMDAHAAIAMNG